MTTVYDTSALIALLKGERGSETVRSALARPESFCSAANWAEVAQWAKVGQYNWSHTGGYILGFGLKIVPVTQVDAEWAGLRFRQGENLSLADRLCMALADRLDARILTADHEMAEGDPRAVMIR